MITQKRPAGYHKNMTLEECRTEVIFQGISNSKQASQHCVGVYTRLKLLTKGNPVEYFRSFPGGNQSWKIDREQMFKELPLYKSIYHMRKNNDAMYTFIKYQEDSQDILNKYFPKRVTEKNREPYTLQEICDDAKKYKTRKEWSKKSGSIYSVAGRRFKDKLDTICKHMTWVKKYNGKVKDGYYTPEVVKAEIAKYKSISELIAADPGLEKFIYKQEWSRKLAAHLDRQVVCYEVQVTQPNLVKIFKQHYPKADVFVYSRSEADLRNLPYDTKHRPDLCFLNPKTGKFCFIEVKTDRNTNTNRFLDQVDRYKKLGSSHTKFKGCFIVSPTGRYKNSISFVQAIGMIEKMKVMKL